MRELEDEIALLQLRAEQLLIHIQHLGCGSADAILARANLDDAKACRREAERDRLLHDLSRAA